MDQATKRLAQYVKRRGINIAMISAGTNIAAGDLYPSFSGIRPMRADEFLAVCGYLGIDPMQLTQEDQTA